jgi:carbamoyltransferase
MYILGLNISGFHSSAAIVNSETGEIIAAITEERLSRIKNDKSFPTLSIEYCKKIAKIEWSKIDKIIIGWNPIYYYASSPKNHHSVLRNRENLPTYVLSNLFPKIDLENEKAELSLTIGNILCDRGLRRDIEIKFINHHEAHWANAYYQSGFDDTDVLILDGFGETTTGFIGYVKNQQVVKESEFNTPHSLGMFYSAFTEFLGFQPNGDEWKVMALASLGDPKIFYNEIRELISIDGLKMELDLSYFNFYLNFRNSYINSRFIEKFGNPVTGKEVLNQKHYDLVAALQKVAEDVVFELLNEFISQTKNKNLVVGGGFFMNSVLNGKIKQFTDYENIYIGGSPDDTGIATGSALFGVLNYKKNSNSPRIETLTNYHGKVYSDEEIETTLLKIKITYEKFSDSKINEVTVNHIKSGKVVAWFQDSSEFGQRALGNRSILADPTNPKIKDIVNESIKYREGFRPFAPSILAEFQTEYFDCSEDDSSYFMEKVFKFRDKYLDKLPGVVHFDGTGRLQTVTAESNLKYYNLIKEFHNVSGHPILLNTSFNINGMPLVESPVDAIECFYKSGIDILVMGNFLISK